MRAEWKTNSIVLGRASGKSRCPVTWFWVGVGGGSAMLVKVNWDIEGIQAAHLQRDGRACYLPASRTQEKLNC